MIIDFRKAASEHNMGEVRRLMSLSEYTPQLGREGLSIALGRNPYNIINGEHVVDTVATENYHNIAMEILSFPGALDLYFSHLFRVDNSMRKNVHDYIIKRDNV
jgi:hypothetical protein